MNKKSKGKKIRYFLTPKEKGLQKEEKVCQFLIQKGWRIIYKNKKILGVELDILARKNKDYIAIEVKSISHPGQIEKILRPEQKYRLEKAVASLYEKFNSPPQLFLAVIDPKNQIDFFQIT